MNTPHGTAPVYLHDVLYQLQTGFGSRVRPVKDGSDEMVCIPVVVVIADNGNHTAAIVEEWQLVPYLERRTDKDTGEVIQKEQIGRFVLTCSVPPGWHLVKDAPATPEPLPDTTHVPEPVPWTVDPLPARAPDEFDGTYPVDYSRPAGFGQKDKVPNAADQTGLVPSDHP